MVTTFLAISLIIRAIAGCADCNDQPEKPIRATIIVPGGYREKEDETARLARERIDALCGQVDYHNGRR